MNRIYRSIWNEKTGTFVAASENARCKGRKSSPGATAVAGGARFARKVLAVSISLMLAFSSNVYAAPTGGAVSAGSASIASGAGKTTISQSSQNVAINWQSFNIGQAESVRFLQPNSSSIALNRVLGSDPSSILGILSANGKVFLLNPNGILFGKGAQVNVGGLVASTLNITDGDFMAGNYKFAGTGNGTVLNQGSINADGGYVVLLGANVSNQGVISAKLGTVALAAGNAMTLDVAGDGLLNVSVNQGAVNALVRNGGLIRADGGQVLLTAQAAGNLLQSAVNNTGVIQAQTIENRNGTIRLMGDMQSGTVNVGGSLDASAPVGGNGGFIETSAAHVKVQDNARISTAAARGRTGTWLIDPFDFIIGAGGDIAGATLGNNLVTNNVTISSNSGTIGVNGDIFVNDAVSWTASTTPTTLTLNAVRDVNVNAAISATNGNFVVCCGRDANVNAAITTVNGSILLAAGRNVNAAAAITATDGNISMCAGHDVNVSAALTLTRGSTIPAQTLGLPLGLVLSAGNDGTGPGIAGGTVVFAPLTPPAAITVAPVNIYYNPISYTTPTDYSTRFTLTEGATLDQFMLVFPNGDRAFNGGTSATLSGFRSTATSGTPAGVTLVAGPGSTAVFDTAGTAAGTTNTFITFSGYSLGGPNAGDFALPASCCGPVGGRTAATITAAVPPTTTTTAVPTTTTTAVPTTTTTAVPTTTTTAASTTTTTVSSTTTTTVPPTPRVIVVPPVVPLIAPLPVPPGLNLSVIDTGVRMPPVQVAATPPVEIVPIAAVPEAPPVPPPPVAVPPKVFVPPQRPPRPDRN